MPIQHGDYVRTAQGKLAYVERVSGNTAAIRAVSKRAVPGGGARTVELTKIRRCKIDAMIHDNLTGRTERKRDVTPLVLNVDYRFPRYMVVSLEPGELIEEPIDPPRALQRCTNCGGKNTNDRPCRLCNDTGEVLVAFPALNSVAS